MALATEDKTAKERSSVDRERDDLFRTALHGRLLTSRLTWAAFIQGFHDGYFFMEGKEGIFRLRLLKREIVPVPAKDEPFHIPHGTRRTISKSGFTVSTNQAFEQVMQNCAQPRPDGDEIEDRWIRKDIKQLLRESHQRGYAHSLEIWQEETLAGGVIGIQINAAFISLSVFRHVNGAGNAAFIELHKRLCYAGFIMHDTIVPSNISRFFGSGPISYQDDFLMRRKAHAKQMAFPCDPIILPAEQFAEKPKHRTLHSFPGYSP